MVLTLCAVNDEGQSLGNTPNIKVSMHHKLCELWKGMVGDGIITKVQYHVTCGKRRSDGMHPCVNFHISTSKSILD